MRYNEYALCVVYKKLDLNMCEKNKNRGKSPVFVCLAERERLYFGTKYALILIQKHNIWC